MGAVKDEIKGPAPKRKAKAKSPDKTGNILQQITELKDEISELTAQKDEDTINEDPSEKPENMRKAATLRACHALVTAIEGLLEDY